jgi:hypothetical protein
MQATRTMGWVGLCLTVGMSSCSLAHAVAKTSAPQAAPSAMGSGQAVVVPASRIVAAR